MPESWKRLNAPNWRWVDDLAWDVRYACRSLLQRDRAFAAAAVTMLALAIGLNVIVFTVARAELFRGFPLVQGNDRLVAIQEIIPSGNAAFSYLDYEDWRSQAHSFRDIAAVISGAHITFSAGHARPDDLQIFTVTANTFGLLGVPPILGRDFVPSDQRPGAAPVAILNYRFWESRFGSRADVIGSTVRINGAPATIVGVMPQRFEFPHQADLWMPAVITTSMLQRSWHGGYLAFGRLRPGATFVQARAELESINAGLQAAFPATNREHRLRVVDNEHFHAGPNGPIIYATLWIGACFVLLIACANVANLTLVRTIGRGREFSIRLALGAGLGRMARQIVAEGLIVVSIAGACGWGLVSWGVRTWAAATASPFQVLDYRVDSSTFAYLVAVALFTGVLLSLPPLTRIAQLRATGAFRTDSRGITQPVRGRRLAATLVAGQMALAVVLLSGAGVLARSLWNIVDASTGVREPDRLLVGLVRLPSGRSAAPDARLAYFKRLRDELTRVPGVAGASLSSSLPVRGGRTVAFEIEGRAPLRDRAEVFTQVVTVGPDYFRVVGARSIAGRVFDEADRPASLQVAMVNRSMADAFWPGESPVGKRVRLRDDAGEWRTVVGVVSNIMEGDPVRQQFKPVAYVPIGQAPPLAVRFLARTEMPPQRVARAVRRAVEGIDPDVIVQDFRTFDTILAFDGDYSDLQHMELGKDASVAPIFALVALLLSAIGLYAVVADSVSRRTQEIGVRIAIGAAPWDIWRLVLRGGMTPVALGAGLGLAGSFAVNRLLASQLVAVSPYDPATMAGAIALLIATALLACQSPACRAIGVDPVVALRAE